LRGKMAGPLQRLPNEGDRLKVSSTICYRSSCGFNSFEFALQ